ncbi:hypothetical protein Cni_G29448 [Canna indica]|uniref:EGF-like domain-containing protein n=1 Tax=Canna indica TaxID=4628 RepID=A0AAQ3L4T8_9LILI|nr:hypothetical protein Cni_G29448 [Canna indica]
MENPLGFVCNCDHGWSQFHVADHFRFLPCVVPNCSINYSCHNESVISAPPPFPPATNLSLWDPCLYNYCGGGTCVDISAFEHRCDCKDGFHNLLNVTSFPCFNDCSLGADCADLGIILPNSTAGSSPSPSLSDAGNSSSAGTVAPNALLVLMVVSVIPIAMARQR